MTELRRAVVFCLGLPSINGWKDEDVAGMCPSVTKRAVKRYLTQLVGLRVLERNGLAFRKGPHAAEWMATKPKTRAGGNSREYLAQKAARDHMRQQDWQDGRGRLTCQTVPDGAMLRQDRKNTVMSTNPLELTCNFTVIEVAKMLRISERTIWRKIGQGEIAVIRPSVKLVRINRAEVERLLMPSLSTKQEVEAAR